MTDNSGANCSIADCGKRAFGRGWCSMHYARWRKHGDPLHQTRPYVPQGDACSIDDCSAKPRQQGLCHKHWKRIATHGDATAPRERLFWVKVNKTGPVPDSAPQLGPCWIWVGYVDPVAGYGRFGGKGSTQLPHRIAYQFLVGPIPEGLSLDHLCRVRACVNPQHLEPVTQRENIARGIGGDSWGYVPDSLPPKAAKLPKPPSCTEGDCGGEVYKRTICRKHYRRWLRDPSVERPSQRTPEQRFWAKVEKTDTCWLWTAMVNRSTGYGHFGVRHGVMVGAHRFAFELIKGSIPEGFDIHHSCLVRRCVNPDHLEAVTRAENLSMRANRRT